jgi:hypothetical protein
MSKKRILLFIVASFLISTFLNVEVQAQITSVFTAGLSQPTKIMLTPQGNLLVTETLGPPNSGRVSIVDRGGRRRTLIDGLPSGISPEGPSGPTGLDMRGRTLFVAIGEGDATVAGPIPGTQLPNPNPSSPLLSSVLAINFSTNVERTTQGFSLSMDDQSNLAFGNEVTLSSGRGNTVTVKLLADFPDFAPNPIQPLPTNVRASNPFALVVGGDDLFVADAGSNSVRKVNIASGNWQTLTVFPPRPNPLPFGAPVIDAVPDGIRIINGQLLVALLTGFPFVPGLSEVRRVDTETGSNSTFIGGRSSAIDVLGGNTAAEYYVLEFSTNFLANAPGQLLLFQSPTSSPTVVAGGLISPSGMVRDTISGDIYITENFTGRIIRVSGF